MFLKLQAVARQGQEASVITDYVLKVLFINIYYINVMKVFIRNREHNI